MVRASIENIGAGVFFAADACAAAVHHPADLIRPTARAITRMLVRVLPILILLTFIVTFVLVLGGYTFFARLGAQPYFGLLIAILVFRFQGPFMVGLLFNATWTTLNTAEIATQKINEEVDALTVMGVDPLHELAAPRVLAAVLLGPLFTAVTMAAGYLAAVLATLAAGLGTWVVNQWILNVISSQDIIFSILFGTLMCFLEIIVSCFKALSASPGPDGVRRAVTQNVVANLYMAYVVSLVMTVVLQATVWRIPA
ncbi:MAG: ABC transporter permease [Nitrospirae bacterium]|nr:ABC transporter permease [Nitrospirota bacterium]